MKLAEIKQLSLSSSRTNTTNGWGFGGYTGTAYLFNDEVQFCDYRYYYRHMGPTIHKFWCVEGREVHGSPEDTTWEILKITFEVTWSEGLKTEQTGYYWFDPNNEEIPDVVGRVMISNYAEERKAVDFKIFQQFKK